MTSVGFGHQPQRHALGIKHVKTVGAPHVQAIASAQRQHMLFAEEMCNLLLLFSRVQGQFSLLYLALSYPVLLKSVTNNDNYITMRNGMDKHFHCIYIQCMNKCLYNIYKT
ncbi:hypothetical protein D3C79_931750 [compost metagenome]